MCNYSKGQYRDENKTRSYKPVDMREINKTALDPDDPGIETQEHEKHCDTAFYGSRALRSAILRARNG